MIQENKNTGLEIDTGRVQKVMINEIVNNMGEYRKISHILQSQSFLLFVSFSISFLILYISIVFLYDINKESLQIDQIFNNYKEISKGILITFFTSLISLYNDLIMGIIFLYKSDNETIIQLLNILKSITENLTFETRPLTFTENITLIVTLFIFILLNFLNIIQAAHQNKLTNSRITNYYTPKIFILLNLLRMIDKNKIYIKRIKSLRTQTNFKDKTISEQLNKIFFLKEWEKYEIDETNTTFFIFYSYTILEIKEIKQEEKTNKQTGQRGRPTNK